MAEEEDVKENEESENLQIGPAPPKPKSANKQLIIVIAGIVAFLIIVILSVLIFLFSSDSGSSTVRGTEEEAEFVEQYNKRMQETLEPGNLLLYTDPFNYSANMKNGMNYIHITVRAVLYDATAVAFLEARTPLIDDKILTILKNKLPQDIKTRTGLELLKQEIYIAFNQLFPQDFIEQSQSKDRFPIKDILIVEYYIQ